MSFANIRALSYEGLMHLIFRDEVLGFFLEVSRFFARAVFAFSFFLLGVCLRAGLFLCFVPFWIGDQ